MFFSAILFCKTFCNFGKLQPDKGSYILNALVFNDYIWTYMQPLRQKATVHDPTFPHSCLHQRWSYTVYRVSRGTKCNTYLIISRYFAATTQGFVSCSSRLDEGQGTSIIFCLLSVTNQQQQSAIDDSQNTCKRATKKNKTRPITLPNITVKRNKTHSH